MKQGEFFKLKPYLVKEVIDRFYYKERLKFYSLVPLSMIASLFEYMGLVFIFQFVLILSNPKSHQAELVFDFFNKYFHIEDFSKIIFIFGVALACVYILKDIYMFIFVRVQNFVLKDLSVRMSLRILKNFLFQDFVTVSSIPNHKKQGILSKASMTVWSYVSQYINLICNIMIIFILIGFLFVKFTLSAVISFVFISGLSYIGYRYLKYKAARQNALYTKYFDALNKITYTIINATKEIRINHKNKTLIDELDMRYEDFANLNKQRCSDSVFHIYFTEISIMFTFILILSVLYLTTDFSNQLLISTIAAIVAVILRITPAINRTQCAIYGINSNEKTVLDLIEFDDKFERNCDYSIVDKVLPFKNSIELKDVDFSYKNDKDGLKNINLKIKKGEFIGIVGRSGCYKTTLSLVISGLIKPQKGEIFVDDTPLREISAWQNNISILSQDFAILKNNIFEGVSDDLVEKLDLSGLSENPLKLSFGQKQRAALADILSKEKELLILDEITSSNDVLSEEKINDILKTLKGEKTIISIAHRLQILKHCDRVIYMNEGQIVDIGTFQELNDKHEDFRKIIELSTFKVEN